MRLIKSVISTALDWPYGTFVFFAGVLTAIPVCWLLYIGASASFAYVDSHDLPTQTAEGTVTSRDFRAEHTVLIPMNTIVNGIVITNQIPSVIPDTWTVCVSVEDGDGCLEVNESVYDEVDEGSIVHVDYVTGRLSGDFYAKQIGW